MIIKTTKGRYIRSEDIILLGELRHTSVDHSTFNIMLKHDISVTENFFEDGHEERAKIAYKDVLDAFINTYHGVGVDIANRIGLDLTDDVYQPISEDSKE